ncbi:hypothetical protein OAN21_02790 [Alphaproteobacteria bacterium]|nr:hypothetical protein [Alphaproteobacteria bacterium]
MVSIKRILSFSLFTLFIGYVPLSLSHTEEKTIPTSPWKPLPSSERELSKELFPSLKGQSAPTSSIQTHHVFLPPELQIISWEAQPMMKGKSIIDTDQMTAVNNRLEVVITLPRDIYNVITRLTSDEKRRMPEDPVLVCRSYAIPYTADHLRMGFLSLFETKVLGGEDFSNHFSGVRFRKETFFESVVRAFRPSSSLLTNLKQR